MFSKATEYGLRAVMYIAQKGSEEHKVTIDEIASAIHSPKSFTAKIMQSLTRENGIVHSVRGVNGGFYISEQSKKLPVRSLLIALDDSDVLEKCVLGLKKCSELNPCPMHEEYKSIKKQLLRLFENKSIGELANEMKLGKVFLTDRKI